jgi:hypothetical protein
MTTGDTRNADIPCIPDCLGQHDVYVCTVGFAIDCWRRLDPESLGCACNAISLLHRSIKCPKKLPLNAVFII